MPFEFIKKILSDIKHLDSGVNDYKKIVQNPYIPSIAYVNWAIYLAEAGCLDEAQDKLVASTLMAHQTPEAYINLGVLKVREGNLDEAIKYYGKALRIDSNNAKAYCFLGNALTEKKEFKEAEKCYEKALKFDPNNSDILLNWGISLVRQQKFKNAKEKFERSCKINGSNFMALYFLGLVDMELGNTEKAKEKFKFIISTIPNHYESLYYLAYIFFKEGKNQESLLNALKSLTHFKKKIETYMLIAENYMNLKEEQKCLEYYELGQKEANINYFFMISWGIALQNFNHIEASCEKFESAVKMDEKNELAYGYLGVNYFKIKNYDKAKLFFEKTLELNPKNIVSLDYLGQICFERQDYKGAIKFYEQELKTSAKMVGAYLKIAKAYHQDNNIEKANEYYEKSIEYMPDEISGYIEYSKFLIEQKIYNLALKKLQKACKIEDKNLECLELLFKVNYILAKENLSDYNIESALNIAKKIEKEYPDLFIYHEEKRDLEVRLKS